tara:strand:+ start:135 stop:572 length:438 start_codon:yes stop_codon:yes gene_type:complete
MTKWNDDTRAKLIEGYKLGMTQKLACQYSGISAQCFHQWKEKASSGGQEFFEFFEELKRAEAHSAAHALASIKRAAQAGTWTAAAWLLERRHDYRRDRPLVLVETSELEERLVDPNTQEGRESIISQISQLPEEMILAALNRSEK